jgi:endonuclease/exonuclease/phosphatase family metal-dependent hydrolase
VKSLHSVVKKEEANLDFQSMAQNSLGDTESDPVSLKVLTLNMHKGFGVFNRRFILPELREAVRQLSSDLVFLQEVHGTHSLHARHYPTWPPVSQYEFMADQIWPDYAYGRNATYSFGDHGNALLSKYPIVHYENLDISIGSLEQRGLLHSIIEIPGKGRLHAICVHLGLRECHRRLQLKQICERVNQLAANEPVVVAGDFNDWGKKADSILTQCNLQEVFKTEHQQYAKSFPAKWPFLCLDRIYIRNLSAKNPLTIKALPWKNLSDHLPLAVELII